MLNEARQDCVAGSPRTDCQIFSRSPKPKIYRVVCSICSGLIRVSSSANRRVRIIGAPKRIASIPLHKYPLPKRQTFSVERFFSSHKPPAAVSRPFNFPVYWIITAKRCVCAPSDVASDVCHVCQMWESDSIFPTIQIKYAVSLNSCGDEASYRIAYKGNIISKVLTLSTK